jgi:hypothetical protein
MEPRGEASGTWYENRIIVAGQNKSQGQASLPNHGPAEHNRSNRAPGKSGGNHRTQHSGHHNRQPRDPAAVTSKPRHPLLGRTRWSRRMANLWCQLSRLKKPAKALKVISQLART